MKAIVTVIGKDKSGIISRVSGMLADIGANVEDISQTVMQEYFVMIMLAEMSKCRLNIADISRALEELGEEVGVSIRIQREDIFQAMHRI